MGSSRRAGATLAGALAIVMACGAEVDPAADDDGGGSGGVAGSSTGDAGPDASGCSTEFGFRRESCTNCTNDRCCAALERCDQVGCKEAYVCAAEKCPNSISEAEFIGCGYSKCAAEGLDALDAWKAVLGCVWGPCAEECSRYCGDGICDSAESCSACAPDCCPGTAGTGGGGGTDAGTCNPAFCPSGGVGAPCCLTPDGPCGLDYGIGCVQAVGDGGFDAGPEPDAAGGCPTLEPSTGTACYTALDCRYGSRRCSCESFYWSCWDPIVWHEGSCADGGAEPTIVAIGKGTDPRQTGRVVLAVDGQHLFAGDEHGQIVDVTLPCGSVSVVVEGVLGSVQDLAVDATNIYFLLHDARSGSGELTQVPRAGGPARSVPMPFGRPTHNLTLTNEALFFSWQPQQSDRGIWSSSKTATPGVQLATGSGFIVVTALDVWWLGHEGYAGGGTDGIFRVSRTGGSPSSAFVGALPSASTTNGFVSDGSNAFFSDGDLQKLSLTTGSIDEIASCPLSARCNVTLATDGSHVYVAGSPLRRAPVAGGTLSAVSGSTTGGTVNGEIALDSTRVYWPSVDAIGNVTIHSTPK